MRCASIGIGLTASSASTTGSPRVKFGTKWLSMTSTCAQSALEMAPSSRSRLAKSADRIDGEICTRDTLATRAPSAFSGRQELGDGQGAEADLEEQGLAELEEVHHGHRPCPPPRGPHGRDPLDDEDDSDHRLEHG